MSKYDRWRRLLLTLDADEIDVTFQQLDEIASLPKSAHDDAEWWANKIRGRGPAQAKAWLDAGYHAHPNLKAKTVSFKKNRSGADGA
jgi:hypothetical protein